MNAPLDLTGKRYGRLVGLRRLPNRGRHTMWLMQCDCGNQLESYLTPLRSGRTISCGCAKTQHIASLRRTHGLSTSGEHRAWSHAKQRCQNPNDAKFANYGGRGIKMCDRWAQSFEAFYADMGPKPKGTSLDRIDVNGDYEPNNCRWATWHQQFRNTTRNVFVEVGGEVLVLKDFAKKMGVDYKRLSATMRRLDMGAEEAVNHIRE